MKWVLSGSNPHSLVSPFVHPNTIHINNKCTTSLLYSTFSGGAHIATSTKHRTTAKQEGRPISPILSPKSKEKRNKGRKAVMSTNRRKTESAASRRKAVELKRLFDAVKAAPVRLPSIKPPCFWTFGDWCLLLQIMMNWIASLLYWSLYNNNNIFKHPTEQLF